MSYTTINGMRSARYPLQGMGDNGDGLGAPCGCLGCPPCSGIGQLDLNSPTARVLGGMAVATVITGGIIWALVWGTKAPKGYAARMRS